MTKKETKQKLKKIPVLTLDEIDKRDGVQDNYDHLEDAFEKYFKNQKKD